MDGMSVPDRAPHHKDREAPGTGRLAAQTEGVGKANCRFSDRSVCATVGGDVCASGPLRASLWTHARTHPQQSEVEDAMPPSPQLRFLPATARLR